MFLWQAVPALPAVAHVETVTPWAPDAGEDVGKYWVPAPAPEVAAAPAVHAVAHDAPSRGYWK